jgi:Ni/Co efflux regulator RcnB
VQQQAIQQQQQRQFDGRDRANRNGGDRRNWTGGQVQQNQTNGGWSRDRGSWSHDRDGDLRQRQAEQQTRSSSRWAGNWNRDWRNDRRYDWRNYRNSHRSIFHIGVYYDPFGYNYRPFDIGYQLYPAYLGRQYWIDASLYQLPYPPPGTTWVRYWNDALLVDMYSGEVVDVIRDFFW